MAAAGAPATKPSAVCLLTGTTEHMSPLVVNHSPTETHMHTVQLIPDKDNAMLKSIHTSDKAKLDIADSIAISSLVKIFYIALIFC